MTKIVKYITNTVSSMVMTIIMIILCSYVMLKKLDILTNDDQQII